ncbi:bifunctional [glutamate--ammonia ligase]-adenylyl-L-tyrosine phosphorylase/[glutamate--ammonia-ligase] adenylyltransferase [Reinekea thalattae]|uniref:Bifunctional glutamine synthetase adenylyltransferase/adenylyl-removing enzyme n=1 Tax=Reinekea thalattae TaxID=2593301 RepID=A0A5C8Z4I9_9GAMM|nr:bifunctional [glutamate--ammonia ligase]-adenylyl-L-tyrosine phosphorylase/[glutamate--ammonia-ligase] adenylyltransferase [Reinekea thalattae]TXR51850.1 bifunctional [glutamate--ammonia ligase]-adenylyl-L-tyrosine phosphorylase/[glutamate--ammonia-ligase] adenylyltransferase [Reinekea thalattae]
MSQKQQQKERELLACQPAFLQLDESLQKFYQTACFASPWLFGWLKSCTDWSAFMDFVKADVDANRELEGLSNDWRLDDEAGVMKQLRCWRNRHMARLICRDQLQLNNVRTTAKAVSDLADSAVNAALKWSTDAVQQREGVAASCRFSGQPEQLVVIAMGKHGAQELNLSSDIDLIFAYPSQAETDKDKPHEQLFTRIARKLIKLLDARTADGFVFRVDMRLRPWGQSGALVSNFSALQNYYLQHGRFWERFAMVKARSITGAAEAQAQLQQILMPFVYRRYVDYQAIGALRELKQKMNAEVRRHRLDRNIKLGRGGIREVEFIAQVFQLIRGGQDVRLQQRGTWPVLSVLAEVELLPFEAVEQLQQAYDFLRDLEHRIQAIDDQQGQTLPSDELSLMRLACAIGYSSVDQLEQQLQHYRDQVHQHFSLLISEESEQLDTAELNGYRQQWLADKLENNEPLVQRLAQFRDLAAVQRLAPSARQNLDALMPILWAKLQACSDAASRFDAIAPILEAVLRRTSYFSLLAENPAAVSELVKLVPQSQWLANNFIEKPYLLDELIDLRSLYSLPTKVELMDELHQQLLRIPEEDLEQQMEVMRHFRHAKVLRAAACEITGLLPLMKISDYLAWVAEVVVEQSLSLAWQQMLAKYGRPSCLNDEVGEVSFGVIAYGKMGGLELSYESDLDLVFIHRADPQGATDGPKVIENPVFMARLGQKLIHLLSAQTASGSLYEVDMRLRPSGNSGMLVSSVSAFADYQQREAWVWEHQALVRARFIAGDASLKQAFDQIRQSVLCQPRSRQLLLAEVTAMRQKMRQHQSAHVSARYPGNDFNVKQDDGGIIDLEFMVQFWVLLNAHDYPQITRFSDNVRTLNELSSAGIVSQSENERLQQAYLTLRQAAHHCILSAQSSGVVQVEKHSSLAQAIEDVISLWRQHMLT